jgi:phosphoribosylformylglycinamidine synthase
VDADPYEGGKQAVAECWRNLTAVGADPIAVTDNLNFGNPERPEVMGQFVRAVQGIGEACRALDFPVVSGNVSLYNETNGIAILPTPTIGGVGLLRDVSAMATLALKTTGELLILIGGRGKHLGQSIYLREIFGSEEGAPPPVDLAAERRHGDFVRNLIRTGRISAVHDISDGGLIQCIIEMMLASDGLGAELRAVDHVALFCEDQARYALTAAPGAAAGIEAGANAEGIPAEIIGEVISDASLIVGESVSISLNELRHAHESWFPAYMESKAA